jgi:hypothetical protein
MQWKCDICGNVVEVNSNFCGRCNVDLRESIEVESSETENILDECQKLIKDISLNEKPKKEEIIKWCEIRAICNSFEMEFPLFLMISILLAKGERYLGFCDCPVCNKGYRELLAWIAMKDKMKFTAQSRAIVKRGRTAEIDGLAIDISLTPRKSKEKKNKSSASETNATQSNPSPTGKISIEIDPDVLEDIVIRVMSGERGWEIIQSVPRKYYTKGKNSKKANDRIE